MQRTSLFGSIPEWLKTLLTVMHIYWIGFYYFVYEFLLDRWWVEQHQLDRRRFKKRICVSERNIAVVTGGDGTIGSKILELLDELHFFVIVIGLESPKNLSANGFFIKCDLLNLSQVESCAKGIKKIVKSVDLLICNAGVMLAAPTEFSKTVVEPHIAVNVLAHAFLFNELESLLEKSSWENSNAIFLSSSTCHAGNIFSYLHGNEAWYHQLSGYGSYADSKLIIALYTKFLANSLKRKQSKIRVSSLHPGVVAGSLYRNVFGPFRFFINVILAPFLRSSRTAATYILNLALENKMPNGSYYESGVVVKLPALNDGNADLLNVLGDKVNRKINELLRTV